MDNKAQNQDKTENSKTLRKDIKKLTEQYYTKKEIVNKICNKLSEKLNISSKDMIIEPSAGNGAFIHKIKSLSENYMFFDTNPQHDEIQEQDFLQFNYLDTQLQYSNIHVIGNPPFGRLSSIALKLLNMLANSVIVLHLFYLKVSKKIAGYVVLTAIFI